MDENPIDEPEPEMRVPTGADYSRLLVDRTLAYLDEAHDGNATDEDVARYLDVTHEKVQQVLQGGTTFGTAVFKRLAAQNKQNLIQFMAILIRWKRKEREVTGEDD